jgi:hypothetical protein
LRTRARSGRPEGRVALALATVALAAALGAARGAAEDRPTAPAAVTPGDRGEVAAPRWQRRSERGALDVTIGPRSGAPRIGPIHEWVVTLKDREGRPVHPARIAVDGGMPAHGHGLPTQPKVTEYLGDGRYLVSGVRFNMAGAWVWRLAIETPDGADRVTFDLDIDW